jgi:hypothetical protein
MQPEKKFRAGAIEASVWANEIEKEGVKRTVHNVNIQKNYKDGEAWKQTSQFSVNDLPKVQLVASEAYKYLALKDTEQ